MPEAPVHGHVGNGSGLTSRFAKLIPSPMQPQAMKVGQWGHTHDVLKGILNCPFADIGGCAQLAHNVLRAGRPRA